MECPYIRNVIFQKIQIDSNYDDTLFTFSAQPIHDTLSEMQNEDTAEMSESYESNMAKIKDYVITNKPTRLPRSNMKKKTIKHQIKLHESTETNELLLFQTKVFPNSKVLKPININDYQGYLKLEIKYKLDLRIFNLSQLTNVQNITKQPCEIVLLEDILQIKTLKKEEFKFELSKVKLNQDYSLGVFIQSDTYGLIIQQQTPSEITFVAQLKQQFKKQIDPNIQPLKRLSLQELISSSNTFDILLYQSNRWMSQIQRFVTNSDYDHVSIILKSANHKLFVFDCNSTNGVCLIPLQSYKVLAKNNTQLKLFYRKFNGKILEDKILKLQQFVKSVIGKKYSFTASSLLNNQTDLSKDTFFCSQLIARTLQQVGFMKPTRLPHHHLPKHFGQKQFNLLNCSYSEPTQIIFN